jgi:hypothetical protein
MDQNVLMAFNMHYPSSNSDSQSKTNKSKPPKLQTQQKTETKNVVSKSFLCFVTLPPPHASPFVNLLDCSFLPWKPFSLLAPSPLSSIPNLPVQRPFPPLPPPSNPDQILFFLPKPLIVLSKNTNLSH